MKKALITGVTGQDGSYLAEFLLEKGYDVHGIIRRASTFNTGRIDHIYKDPHNEGSRFHLHYGDLADANTVRSLIYKIQPDEFYNLGAQSHVRVSFDIPEYTANVTGVGTLRVLEAIKDFEEHTGKKVKFYQASSSEMFGATPPPQNEKTPFHPRSPYGVSKVFSFYATQNYREAYGMFAVNGILFNHESERRGETFVTKKITKGVSKILAGVDKKIFLGNLDARRDWGYAPEYCQAMWMMLQQPQPEDYVIGTGESHSVKDFVSAAFAAVGISNWQDYVGIDPRYYRPSEVENLIADTRKAREKLGWQPKTKFDELVKIMMKHDLEKHGLKAEAEKIRLA
ncbi:MAG: GDP-mannose 4,6-dehydratase [Candidatus Liptonbacteria bacterium]|nr:GDP-mannose 4,6-dehydratase [Parcubacteria group bacterium]MBI4087316.1 GDP-mannose 4,6-dehydratase [Candidatus Liptonbacteria bacterium]